MRSLGDAAAATEPVTFVGRTFSAEEVRLIEQLLANHPNLSRHELAATVCELLEWKRPNGRLKTRECRDLLERLQSRAGVTLPHKRPGRPRGSTVHISPVARAPVDPITRPLAALQPIHLVLADNTERRRRWREHVQQFHYLGCATPYGAHLRYLIECDAEPTQLLGALQYSSAAWRMAPRDEWIGWDDATRKLNLQRVINQSRFLILPWVEVHNLASHVLALSSRQVAGDWERVYNVRPLLLESLVDQQRYQGTCYRAANWIYVGRTTGRGRMDRRHEHHGRTPKQIFLYPLARRARVHLNRRAAT